MDHNFHKIIFRTQLKGLLAKSVVHYNIIPVAPSQLTSHNSVGFSLLSDPADNDSPKYKVTQRIINGSEDIRTLIEWMKDCTKILDGL